ncbi:glycosyltransferase family 9 protein [bacterium]|nr:glycosyltransferase family 9 protein [bacterium]
MKVHRMNQEGGVGGRLTVVQLARFGDLIQTSPLLQNLQSTAAELTLVVDRRVVRVARMLEGVDRVVGVDLSRPPLPNASHSLAENLQVMKAWAGPWMDAAVADKVLLLNQGDVPALIAKAIDADQHDGPFGAQQLPAPHLYLNHALSDRRLNPLHLVEVWAAYGPDRYPLSAPALRRDVGTPFAKHSGEQARTPDTDSVYAVNIGAGAAGRRLHAEKLAELVNSLLKRGAKRVDLIGSPADRPDAWKILEALPHGDRRIRNLVGQTSFEELPAILDAVNVLISSDTGTLQLAAATRARQLGLFFGGANPVETGPYRSGAVALVHKRSLQQNEDDPVGNANELSMEQVAELAVKLADPGREVNEDDDQFNAFDLLVARPSSLGIRYGYVSSEKRLQFGAGQRWLPLLESLIRTDTVPTGESHKAGSGQLGNASGAAALLSDVGNEASMRWMMLGDKEKRWIKRIVHAFETNGYLGWVGGNTPKLEKSYDA